MLDQVRAHPLFIVPADMPDTRQALVLEGAVRLVRENGDMWVYVSPFTLDTRLPLEEMEDGRETYADLVTPYTPTDAEVVRALRGPMGPVGPQGMTGMPGTCNCDHNG